MILMIVMRRINYLKTFTWKRKVYQNSSRTLKKALFKFRIGTYKLPVNNRRNFNISGNKRLCKISDKAVIDDEQ